MRAVIFVFAFVCAGAQDINDAKNLPKYDKRYDYLNIDAILENKRLVKNYVDCLINVKPCTPEGKALKRILPEALRTKCVRCTESQKQLAVKMIRRLKSDYPEEWKKLSARWDPTGDFTRYFEEHFPIKEPISNEIPGSSAPPSPPTAARPPDTPLEPSSSSNTQPPGPTSPGPVILNRFGDDGSLVTNNSQPARPSVAPTRPSSMRPVYVTRPTQVVWVTAASDNIPTRFSLRPTSEFAPAYTTAITLIDQIGYKIIRTTELVTDILKNTIRAVIGVRR